MGVILMAVGCKQPYAITDPKTGSTYYTQSIKETKDGRVEFRDAVTGAERSIAQPKVREISAQEFRRQTGYYDDVTSSKPIGSHRELRADNPVAPVSGQ